MQACARFLKKKSIIVRISCIVQKNIVTLHPKCEKLCLIDYSMKKILFVTALVAAMLFTACGKKSTPEPVQALVAEMQADVDGINTGAVSVQSLEADGKDIVIDMIFDESEFGGMSFKQGFEMSGVDADDLAEYLREIYFNMHVVSKKMYYRITTMREYECDMIFRFEGSISGDVMEAVLSYEDLPEVSWEDVEALYAKYEGVPEEVIEIIGTFESVFSMISVGITHTGTEMEGHDIVFHLAVDEEALGMDNFIKDFAAYGITEKSLHDELTESFLTSSRSAETDRQIEAMKEGQYNLVMRYFGTKSKQTMQVKITSDEFVK